MPKKILVVDDNKTYRMGVSEGLEAVGYQVDTAEDGLIAQRRLQSDDSIDYVLSDTNMPEIDGIELVTWIHNSGLTKRIKVILNSSNPTYEGIDLERFCESMGDPNIRFYEKADLKKSIREYFPNN